MRRPCFEVLTPFGPYVRAAGRIIFSIDCTIGHLSVLNLAKVHKTRIGNNYIYRKFSNKRRGASIFCGGYSRALFSNLNEERAEIMCQKNCAKRC